MRRMKSKATEPGPRDCARREHAGGGPCCMAPTWDRDRDNGSAVYMHRGQLGANSASACSLRAGVQGMFHPRMKALGICAAEIIASG